MATADSSLIARAPFHNYPWDFLDLNFKKNKNYMGCGQKKGNEMKDRNNLNEFWVFLNHGTNEGAGSPKEGFW
jgi:hypothetical protein